MKAAMRRLPSALKFSGGAMLNLAFPEALCRGTPAGMPSSYDAALRGPCEQASLCHA